VVNQYEKLLQTRTQTFETELKVMESFHETTNHLLVELTHALETMKTFPNVASKVSPASSQSEVLGK
jgi:hypothetical protein